MASTIAHAAEALESRARQRSSAAPRRALAEWVVGAAALLFSAYLLLHLLSFEYGRDHGIYTVVGKGVLAGELPYRDVWDFKPPGIFFVFALAHALFGPQPQAIRIFEALCFASLPWAFAIFSRRHLGSALPGIVGAAFAILVHVELEFWNTAQPSSFAAVVLAWALMCATYEPHGAAARPGARIAAAWLAAGVLYGCAALLKPPLGGGIVASAAVLMWRQRRSTAPLRPSPLLPPLVLACGALLPLLAAAAYFTALGGLRELYEALGVFAPRYTALGLRDASFAALLLRAIGGWLTDFVLVNPIGVALLAVLPPIAAREREGALHVAGVIAFVLLGVALQAKFFAYHFGAALVLTGLLAGWGFWKLWLRLRGRPLGRLAVAGLVLAAIAGSNLTPGPGGTGDPFWARCSMRLVAWLDPSLHAGTTEYLYSLRDMNAGTNRRVADWLRAHTPADANVYIWGFEPAIYDMAARRPATRYIYNVPQRATWDTGTAREQLMVDLAGRPPAAIAVQHGDRFAWVTGNQMDSAEALSGFAELQTLLERDYRRAAALPSFDLYLRRSAIPARQEPSE